MNSHLLINSITAQVQYHPLSNQSILPCVVSAIITWPSGSQYSSRTEIGAQQEPRLRAQSPVEALAQSSENSEPSRELRAQSPAGAQLEAQTQSLSPSSNSELRAQPELRAQTKSSEPSWSSEPSRNSDSEPRPIKLSLELSTVQTRESTTMYLAGGGLGERTWREKCYLMIGCQQGSILDHLPVLRELGMGVFTAFTGWH